MKLTNEQLAEIEQKTESLSEDMPFYTWEASRLLDTDVPALLDMIAELQAEVERKEVAESLLSEAHDMLDEDTDLHQEITRYLYW